MEIDETISSQTGTCTFKIDLIVWKFSYDMFKKANKIGLK